MQDFTLLIGKWFRLNKRYLPWRSTKSPYKIWISEIILQQTRVEQGRKYYEKFIEKYPNVQSLASANEEEVLRMWQGLGYYSRARNLLFAARQVVNEFNGEFPKNYKGLIQLKGVGDYTASAIASISFDLPEAVVDGNVYRVLARYYNDATPIDTTDGKKVFKEYAKQLLDKQHPGEHNQAVMELGALICKPQNPLCEECPVNESCLAFRNKNQNSFPVKSKSTKITKRYFHYLIYPSEKIQLQKRIDNDIWKNMYQFPLLELPQKNTKQEIAQLVKRTFHVEINQILFTKKHILSHQHIHTTFWFVDNTIPGNQFILVNQKELDSYPIPRLIEEFIEKHQEIFCVS